MRGSGGVSEEDLGPRPIGAEADLDSLRRQAEEVRRRRDALEREERELAEAIAAQERRVEDLASCRNAFKTCREEALEVAARMDEWRFPPLTLPFPGAAAHLLFLGGCSGEWAQRTRYRGQLPGFGGFVLMAGDTRVLFDPGRTTLRGMHQVGLDPRDLDAIVVSHGHGDATRDLAPVISAAEGRALGKKERPNDRLRLIAERSVLFGRRVDADALLSDRHPALKRLGRARLQQHLAELPGVEPPSIGAFDLLERLGGRYIVLEEGKDIRVSSELTLSVRWSLHPVSYAVERIPALDIRASGERPVRIIYLSDTEYHGELADQYADGEPADAVILHPKTLDVHRRESKKDPLRGLTRRHAGWDGSLRLIQDLRDRGAISTKTLIVLRAWGLETVSRIAEDGALVAAPQKLETYERLFAEETGLRVLVPGVTWAGLGCTGSVDPAVRHVVPPFVPKGKAMQFHGIHYASEAMAALVDKSRVAAESPRTNVLLVGPTGVGKNELAAAIHKEAAQSFGRSGKLVRANVAWLGDNPWDVLVGHVDRTYTGVAARLGIFDEAQNGTLVLDEIHAMTPQLQTMLLTVLDPPRRYRPNGGSADRLLTAQIICTTDRDLAALVSSGEMSEALAHRLAGIVMPVPALSERLEDVGAILASWAREDPRLARAADPGVVRAIRELDLRGNTRQLQHLVEDVARSGDWSAADIRKRHALLSLATSQSSADRVPGERRRVAARDTTCEQILEVLASEARALGRGDLVNRLGLPKSTVNLHLQHLVGHGVSKSGRARSTRYTLSAG